MKKNTNKKYNEVEVYKSYIKAKGTKGHSVKKLCERLNIPRATLYTIVKKIEDGDEIQLNRCIKKSEYDCKWTYRFERRFMIIEDNSGDDYYNQLKALIGDMFDAGFGQREIARRIGKDVSTVAHHLKIGIKFSVRK